MYAGGVILHGMSFEYLFRSVKQYRRHESFNEMGKQMIGLLSYIIFLIKIVLLQEKLSFYYQKYQKGTFDVFITHL